MIAAKTLIRWERGGRDTRHCELDGCVRATTGRKPFCSNHLEEMPYVRGVQERILARRTEWDAVEKRGVRAVDLEGTTALEILEYSRVHGPCTVRRLAKDLSMERSLLDPYVASLRKHRLIRLTANKRGVPVVHFLETAAAPEAQAA